jgi:hypothetical protein
MFDDYQSRPKILQDGKQRFQYGWLIREIS